MMAQRYHGDTGSLSRERSSFFTMSDGRADIPDYVGQALTWARARMPDSAIDEVRFFAHKLGSSVIAEGIYIDIVTKEVIARASVSDRGFCDLEALDCETERQLFYEHHELGDDSPIKVLEAFLDRVTGNQA